MKITNKIFEIYINMLYIYEIRNTMYTMYKSRFLFQILGFKFNFSLKTNYLFWKSFGVFSTHHHYSSTPFRLLPFPHLHLHTLTLHTHIQYDGE